MAHKASPRRTGEMRKQIVRWPFSRIQKAPKKAKTGQKIDMAVHKPPVW